MKYLMMVASLALALGAVYPAMAATGDETGAGGPPAASEKAGTSSEATDAASGDMVTRGAPGTQDEPSSEGTHWRSGGTGSSVEGFGPAQSSEDVLKTDPRSVPEGAEWQPGDPVNVPSVKQPGREESAASGLDRQTGTEDPVGQERETGVEVPDTVSEQQGDPSAGDPGYFTDEKGGTSERGATEEPTVDPLAGQVPGTGEALERDAEMVEVPGAKEPVPTGERGAGEETVVDQQPGNERLLKPEAEQDEKAAEVMRGTAEGETKSSDEAREMIEGSEQAQPGAGGEAERGVTEGSQGGQEQWTGSPDSEKAKQGEVKSWQNYEKMHERAIVDKPEAQ